MRRDIQNRRRTRTVESVRCSTLTHGLPNPRDSGRACVLRRRSPGHARWEAVAARLCAAWRAFATDRGGVTVVEFGMLATPFLALLCVVMEAALLVFAQQTLDVAVGRGTRVLRTGEFQDAADGSDPTARIRRIMCGGAVVFFRCDDMRLDVTRAGSFTAAQVSQPYDSKKKTWSAGFGTHFDCPTGGDVIALRAAVTVPRLFGFLDFTHQNMGPGIQLMVSTAIFRSEPYVGKSCL